MPICQPVQKTIHPLDFRDNTYRFAVESVLDSQGQAGMLTISTSAGYLLTTSLNGEARREQTFDHMQQADGSWVAKGSVTLVSPGDAPVEGMVLIRNPLAETVVLTIAATSESVAPSPQPLLTVSKPALAFTPTAPGKPAYLILTIAQPHGTEPVTLSTDTPEYFQLASDSRPTFLPALTLTPSPAGTHVHVRYFAMKNGLHTGQLTIHNQYEKRTIALEGRSGGGLSGLRKPRPVIAPATLRRSNRLSIVRQWSGVLALIAVSGLAYAGYLNRCQLFPALCPSAGISNIGPLPAAPIDGSARVDEGLKKVVLRTESAKSAKIQEVTAPTGGVVPAQEKPVLSLSPSAKSAYPVVSDNGTDTEAEAVQKEKSNRKFSKQNPDYQVGPKTTQQPVPNSPSEESDLERVLNQTP